MNSHEVLSKGIMFANQIFEEYRDRYSDTETLKIISLGFFRRIIELSDGIWLSADHCNLASAELNYRSLLEATVGFQYLFQDDNKKEDRAIAYKIGYHYQQIDSARKGLEIMELSEEKQEYCRNAIEMHQRFIDLSENTEVVNEWNRLKGVNRRNFSPKWFSLFNGKTSFNALARDIYSGLSNPEIAAQFYSGLSVGAHNFTVLRDWLPNTIGEHKYSDVRYKIEPQNDRFNLGHTLSMLILSIRLFCENIYPEKLDKFRDFLKNDIRGYKEL